MTTLTLDSAIAYTKRIVGEPVEIVNATYSAMEGEPTVYVEFRINGEAYVWDMHVWAENGKLYGEW